MNAFWWFVAGWLANSAILLFYLAALLLPHWYVAWRKRRRERDGLTVRLVTRDPYDPNSAAEEREYHFPRWTEADVEAWLREDSERNTVIRRSRPIQ